MLTTCDVVGKGMVEEGRFRLEGLWTPPLDKRFVGWHEQRDQSHWLQAWFATLNDCFGERWLSLEG